MSFFYYASVFGSILALCIVKLASSGFWVLLFSRIRALFQDVESVYRSHELYIMNIED